MLRKWTPMKAFLLAIGGVLVLYLGLVEITC